MHYGTKRNGHGQVSSHVFYVFTILKLNLGKTIIVFAMIVISAAESKKSDERLSTAGLLSTFSRVWYTRVISFRGR